jgi:hypothetical protein
VGKMDENIDKRIEVMSKKLEDHERRISEIEKMLYQRPQRPTLKPLSIREFLAQKNPKTDTDKILAIGYFIEKHENVPPFNRRDLKNCFQRARESLPSNLNQFINENIKRKYIMEAGEKDNLKAFVLTTSGEKFVESNFQEVKK